MVELNRAPQQPDLVFVVDDPRADDVLQLLEVHLAYSYEHSPPEHVHALDVEELLDPTVTFFSARCDGVLLAVGALKHLDASHSEIKSMHTSETARRLGIGRAMLGHLLEVARERRYRQVSLETGTMDAYRAARAMYADAGFTVCEPFGQYTRNPYSTCMTIRLDP